MQSIRNTNLLDLPTDVSGLILERLPNPEERANYAMTSKQCEMVYLKSVENKRVPDHRPVVEKIREITRKKSTAETLENKSRCLRLGALSAGPFCICAGITLCYSGSGWGCCIVSNAVQNILLWSGIGTTIGGVGTFIGCYLYVVGSNCTDRFEKESAQLTRECIMEEKNCEQEKEKLELPSRVSMEGIGPFYQNY